jgi:nitrile hydratase
LPRKEVSNAKKIKGDPKQNNLASAKFQTGEKVRIISNAFPIGHYRTPMYIRGKIGHIERVLSQFLNPEEEGYGKNDGVRIQLYGVRFKQIDIWPNYAGKSEDSLEIEIYEHWLEKV